MTVPQPYNYCGTPDLTEDHLLLIIMSKIADNQNSKRLLEDTEKLTLLSDYLSIFDLDLEERIREPTKHARNLATMPDRFNDIFAEHGWIATEDIPASLMKQALSINQKDGIEYAEKFICSKFDDDYFKLHSHRMKAIWVWKNTSRERLLNLAYEDHKHGRHHASIPVVLAQIDGLSFDMHKKSFFSNKSALIVNNSVAAHETGLQTLSKKTGKPRNKTKNNPIHFPYRNGILHGRELSYDNELVSTKCFFTLFALRPWALKCQQVTLRKEMGEKCEDIPRFNPGDLLMEKISELLEK